MEFILKEDDFNGCTYSHNLFHTMMRKKGYLKCNKIYS